MKNIINISFISGILIILFIIWNRLLRVRLPKELIPVEDINFQLCIVLSLTIVFLTLFIYYLLLLLQYLPRQHSRILTMMNNILENLFQYGWFKRIYKILTEDIPNGPVAVYNVIYQYIYIKPYVEYLGSKLHNYFFEKEQRMNILYIVLFVLPRILVVFSFIIDIIVFRKLMYFYIFSILLLVPILSKLVIYIIKHHAIHSLEYFKKFFDIRLIDSILRITIIKLPEDNVEDIRRQKALEQDFDRLVVLWESYQYLYNITYQLLEFRINKYKYRLNVLYYGLFFIGFLFYFLILIGAY